MFYRRYNDVLLGAGDVMSDLRKAQPPCQTGSQCIGGKCPECEREWVGLTDEEINNTRVRWTMIDGPGDYLLPLARAIEAKLKEKNT